MPNTQSSPVRSSTPAASKPNDQSSKGTCVLSGIAICENERFFNDKYYNKLYDAQLYVHDEVAGDGLLASLKHYEPARAEVDSEAVRAYFVNATVCIPTENSKGLAINSIEFALDEYDLVGDILSAYPINDWSEDTVDPKQAPYATVSGLLEHASETDEEIRCVIRLENYLGVLDGKGSLSVSIIVDLKSPRWKPRADGKRRAPYLKIGQYITATGPLIGVGRSDDGKLTELHVGADNIVNVGLASRILNTSTSINTPSQDIAGTALDPVTPTPSNKKYTMARLKRAREASEPPSTPQPPAKRGRKTQQSAKTKQAENTNAPTEEVVATQ